MTISSATDLLTHISSDSTEPIISHNFVIPFLVYLGYDTATEVYPAFPTGNGPVDFAVRSNRNHKDIFVSSKQAPELLIEVKGQRTHGGVTINLSSETAQYSSTLTQLKRYLLAKGCESAKFGILTNGKHIQLWRKHHKVLHPVTVCHELNSDNISQIVEDIRLKLFKPLKALVISVYNNQGGVGKTTTVVNLAALLSCYKKKVLVIDFDPQQGDLSHGLKVTKGAKSIIDCLIDKNIDSHCLVQRFNFQFKNGNTVGFDVIPADPDIAESQTFQAFQSKIQGGELRFNDMICDFKAEYDYILIDSPPNWQFFSKSAVAASDVVLIPTRHNHLFSIKNAAIAISKFIPETQLLRNDGGPIALPIFFNNGKQTDAQLTISTNEIIKIIQDIKKDTGFNLAPYFFPRYSKAQKDTRIFEIPSHALIANAAFSRTPAAYKFSVAHSYYKQLVKEYFIQ